MSMNTLWSALILAASAFSAGCSSSHESSGGADSGADASADAHDGTASDGAAQSCPPTYADITQGAQCSGPVTCDYYGQFNCQCLVLTSPHGSWQWQCGQFNCICIPADAAPGTFPPGEASPNCVNQACNSDVDCPSGQHCGSEVAPGATSGLVCSFGCEGDAGPPSTTSCPFGATCEPIFP